MAAIPSALAIPEIVEKILAFVDDDTINDSVLFVCRLWHCLTCHRQIREATWNNRYSSPTEDGPKGFDATLATAHRLYIHLYSKPTDSTYDCLRKAVIHNHNQQIGVPSRRLAATQEQRTVLGLSGDNGSGDTARIQGLRSPRRPHLAPGSPPLFEVIFESFSHFLSPYVYSLFPFFYSITNLTIRCIYLSTSSDLWMAHLLERCPYLEHLKIDAHKCILLKGPWIRPYRSTWDLPLAKYQYHPKHTRLNSFVAINAGLTHGDVQDLLEISPYLKDLRMVVSDHAVQGGFDTDLFLEYARTFFSSALSSSGGIGLLDTFQVSVTGEPIGDNEIERRLFELGPRASNITVPIQDFRPVLLDVLKSRTTVITSLEIVNGDWVPSLELHRYLCESPHLLHLKASKIAIIAEDLYTFTIDPDNTLATGELISPQLPTNTASTIGQQPSGIWACRNLRSLEAAFISQHSFHAGEGGAGFCRRVFGYISRVCPRLNRLEISSLESLWRDDATNYPGMMYPGCMALESGFCLLARLKELKWIRLGTYDSDPEVRNVDVSWILLADETSHIRRTERQRVVSTWAIEDAPPGSLGNSSSAENAELMLSDQLQHLGTLLDVKRMIDEMDAVDGFECWPSLRGISICRQGGFGRGRSQEVKRLLDESKINVAPSVQPPGGRLSRFFASPFSFLSSMNSM
jgi:hypothetical protein